MCYDRGRRKQEQDHQQQNDRTADLGSLFSYIQSSSSQKLRTRTSTSFLSFIGFSSSFPSSFVNPFGFWSPRPSPSKWDCGGLGLGIMSSIVDEPEPFLKASGCKKNVVVRPQYRVCIPKTTPSFHEREIPKSRSLPVSSGTDKIHGPYSSSFSQNAGPSFTSSSSDDRAAMSGSHGLAGGSFRSESNWDSEARLGSGGGFSGDLSQREMELSEDYTRIISHGPNPRTVHVFGDCVWRHEPCKLSKRGAEEEKGVKMGFPAPASYDRSDGFLRFCEWCRRKLEAGEDIYMYRGEKAFCSSECRSREMEISMEEEMGKKTGNRSPRSFEDGIFAL